MSESSQRTNVKAWGKPEENKIVTCIRQSVYDDIYRHGSANPSREVGGILLGSVTADDRGGYRVDVAASVHAAAAPGNRTQMQFTGETWRQLTESALRDFPGYKVVGWYHTHPDLGTFLSGDDINAHDIAFSHPWHMAVVCDPVRNEFSVFGRDGKAIKLISGFYTYEVRQPNPTAAQHRPPTVAHAGNNKRMYILPQLLIMVIGLVAIGTFFALQAGYLPNSFGLPASGQQIPNVTGNRLSVPPQPGLYYLTPLIPDSKENLNLYIIGSKQVWRIKCPPLAAVDTAIAQIPPTLTLQRDLPITVTAVRIFSEEASAGKFGGFSIIAKATNGQEYTLTAVFDAEGNIQKWLDPKPGTK